MRLARLLPFVLLAVFGSVTDARAEAPGLHVVVKKSERRLYLYDGATMCEQKVRLVRVVSLR